MQNLLLRLEALKVGRDFSMSEIYSIIEQIDLKILTALIGLLVLTNIVLTFLVLVQKIKSSKSASVEGEKLNSPQTLTFDRTSNPSAFGGVPKYKVKKKEELELPKLESAIKLIKTSDISQLEIVDRFNIEPEYAKILTKYHRN